MLLIELKQTAANSSNDNNDNSNNNNNSSLSPPPYDELAAEFVAAETKRIREKKEEKD
jgi:hypothetical protein